MFRGDLASNTKLTEAKNNNINNNNNNNNNNHTLRLHNFNHKTRPEHVPMVSTGKRNKPTEEDMKPPLHNFNLPCLKWGSQKLLRCMKVDSNGHVSVVDRNQPSDSGGAGIGTRRRSFEFQKRFRSSCYDDDIDRKIQSCYKFSSSEKVKVDSYVDRKQSSESDGAGGGSGGATAKAKRFRSSYDDVDRKIQSYCRFSSSEKVNVDSNGYRNQPSDIGGAGGGSGNGGSTIGAKRRHSECEKRLRSSYDDVDRKTESYCRFSSPEKVNVDRSKPSESYGGGGVVIGERRRNTEVEKQYRSSSYNNDIRKTESCYNKLSSKNIIKNGNLITGDGEIEATREKLMFDFQNEVVKMKDAILRERLVDPPPSTAVPAVSTPSYNPPAERPWNLRTRRAACKAPRSPVSGVNKSGEVFEPNSSPATKLRPESGGGGGDATTSGEKRERAKFSVSLSRREVEEDFMAMAGRRLPRKPKKRPRVVQKQLDTLFPGLWLCEVTADMYKVPDETETGKR